MKYLILIITSLSSIYSIGQIQKEKIYGKEVIYIFEYSIFDNGTLKKEGEIYLGCLGNLKTYPKGDPQYQVIWTNKKEDLNRKVPSTGIIETLNKVYLHPPRHYVFSILEYTPFPEIHFPISKGQEWSKKLALGKYWVNDKYNMKAEDVLLFEYKYINKQEYTPLFLSNKSIDCYYIYANTTNTNPETSFSGLYNSNYGFVKLTFKNIDNSLIILELKSIKNWTEFF